MKIIDIIEKHCSCTVTRICAEYRGGSRDLYIADPIKKGEVSSISFEEGSLKGFITYISTKPLTKDDITLMRELAGCLVETSEYRDLNDALTQVAGMGAGETMSLEDLLTQTLNTLVYSHFFDKAAVMFLNEKASEFRGITVVGVPPYNDEQTKLFRNIKIPVDKNILDALISGKKTTSFSGGEIFERLDKDELSNNLILSPIVASHKTYGILVLYSKSPYDERHHFAANGTAKFISAMIAAVIVYHKYQYSLISEKQLAEQIKNNETLLTLGNYAATIAHEIKNPLISIGGFAKRIMKAVENPDLKKMAKIISTETERLERLTEDILSYAKKHEPVKIPVNLLEEIENIKTLFEGRCIETNIAIDIDISPNIHINVDKNQFRQVVVNLVANAMNAMEKNGTVNISCIEHGSFDNLVIADTGSGIPEDNLLRLFKPFFTTSKNGTGLGLAISKKIMINHGGDIVAKNGKQGAEFTLIIPK